MSFLKTIWERDRGSTRWGRDGERGSMGLIVGPIEGLEPRTPRSQDPDITTWAEVRTLNRMSHLGTPQNCHFKCHKYLYTIVKNIFSILLNHNQFTTTGIHKWLRGGAGRYGFYSKATLYNITEQRLESLKWKGTLWAQRGLFNLHTVIESAFLKRKAMQQATHTLLIPLHLWLLHGCSQLYGMGPRHLVISPQPSPRKLGGI